MKYFNVILQESLNLSADWLASRHEKDAYAKGIPSGQHDKFNITVYVNL